MFFEFFVFFVMSGYNCAKENILVTDVGLHYVYQKNNVNVHNTLIMFVHKSVHRSTTDNSKLARTAQ